MDESRVEAAIVANPNQSRSCYLNVAGQTQPLQGIRVRMWHNGETRLLMPIWLRPISAN